MVDNVLVAIRKDRRGTTVNFPPQLLSISEIASIAADTEHNIQEFIREDRIPYVVLSDGILIPLGGFQCCMLELYDLAETLRRIQEGFGPDVEED